MDSRTREILQKRFIKNHNTALSNMVSIKKLCAIDGREFDLNSCNFDLMKPDEKIRLIDEHWLTPIDNLDIETYKNQKKITGTIGGKYKVKLSTHSYESGFDMYKGVLSFSGITMEEFDVRITPIKKD